MNMVVSDYMFKLFLTALDVSFVKRIRGTTLRSNRTDRAKHMTTMLYV